MDSTLSTPGVIKLWPGTAPGSEGWDQQEGEDLYLPGLRVIRNVTQPTLTAYFPDPAIANGTAVIVCPGGAFHFLSFDHEGIAVARWLNDRGMAAFVLKYRLIRTGDDFPACVERNLSSPEKRAAVMNPIQPLAAADGLQALRLVRSHAGEWGIAPARIGIMGFSAGGVVTALAASQYDPASRPDFAAPIYCAHLPDMVIPPDAPPLFLLCAGDDGMATAASQKLYAAWKAAGHPVELHIYYRGGHGFGMNKQGLPIDSWIERFGDWLQASGFLHAVQDV